MPQRVSASRKAPRAVRSFRERGADGARAMVFDRCFLVGEGRVLAPRGATAQDGGGGKGDVRYCDFRSWTSGESHHVNVDLVVIDAVEAVVTRNDCRGVCL